VPLAVNVPPVSTDHVCDAPNATGALIVSLPEPVVVTPWLFVLPLTFDPVIVIADVPLTVIPLLVPVPTPKLRLLTESGALVFALVNPLRFALK
jgi:hypothetical protein